MEKKLTNAHDYDDIIHLPHHVSASRPHMPQIDRAAQFAPFAALSGFEAAIEETGRLTEEKLQLGEDDLEVLNRKIQVIQEQIASQPWVEITYFRPDSRKSGGAYVTVLGPVKKVDTYERMVVMQDGTQVPMEEMAEISLCGPSCEQSS